MLPGIQTGVVLYSCHGRRRPVATDPQARSLEATVRKIALATYDKAISQIKRGGGGRKL